MSLSVPYAIDLAQRLSPLGLKWMEEYLSARKPRLCPPPPLRTDPHGCCCPAVPDDYAGHLAVKDALKSLPTMLATAEHEYTRYGYKQLIDSGAVDVLQPDITWLGGITEVRFQPHRGSSGLCKLEERKIKTKTNLDCVELPVLPASSALLTSLRPWLVQARGKIDQDQDQSYVTAPLGSQVRRVIAMASANNLMVIPHGSSVFSYHVVTAFQNCPM